MLLMAHTHQRLVRSSRGAKGAYSFGPTLPVGPKLFHDCEDSSRLHNIHSTKTTPLDVGRITVLEDRNGLPMTNFFVLRIDCAV